MTLMVKGSGTVPTIACQTTVPITQKPVRHGKRDVHQALRAVTLMPFATCGEVREPLRDTAC